MIFVSYSHLDSLWMERFRTMASPLERYVKDQSLVRQGHKAGQELAGGNR